MSIGVIVAFGLLSVAASSTLEAAVSRDHHVEDYSESMPLLAPAEYHETNPTTSNPAVAPEASFANCLIFAVADNLKEHLTTDNVKPVTVLLQHSIQTCPGLNSTFEVFQKIMTFRGLNFAGVMNFINSLQVHNGTETTIVEKEEVMHEVFEEKPIEVFRQLENQDHESVKKDEPEMPDNQEHYDFENMPSNNVEVIASKANEPAQPENAAELIGENYEDAIPAVSIEKTNEAPAPDVSEDHKAEYLKFWNEELVDNNREAQHLQDKMI